MNPATALPSVPATPAAAPSSRPFFIACCVLLLVMECIGYHVTRNNSVSIDFRSFYAAGVILRTHPHQLYDVNLQTQVQNALVAPGSFVLPYYHPPFETLLYAPFAVLPYRAAYFTFVAFNVLLIVCTFFAARPLFSITIPLVQPRPGLIFFLFIPPLVAIMQGQDSILFLLLACLSLKQLEDGKDANAGALLALCLFRFQLAIPIVLLLAVRRTWRFSAGFAATTAALLALCFALVGRAGMAAWVPVLSASSLSSDQGAVAKRAMGIYPEEMGNLRGLLYGTMTRFLSPAHAFQTVAVVSIAVFLVCLYAVRRERSTAVAFAIAVVCAVLVSYHLNFHDETLLLLPILLLVRRTPLSILVACCCAPAILLFFVGTNWCFLMAIPTLLLPAAAIGKAGKSGDSPLSAVPVWT